MNRAAKSYPLKSKATLPRSKTYDCAAVVQLHRDHQAHLECKDNLAFMRPLAKETMHLIVTSPPYNIGKSYEKRLRLESYVSQQAQVISECVRLLHPRGSLCWQVGNHVQSGE